MPACAIPVGSKSKGAVKGIATWATAKATLGALDGFPFVSENIERVPDKFDPESQTGEVHGEHPITLGEDFAGTIDVEADYRRFTRLLALAMGVAGVPTLLEAAISWTHALKMDDEMCNILSTLGVDRVLDTSGANSSGYTYRAKHNGLVISGAQGRVPRFQFPLLCRDITREVDASAWTHEWDIVSAWQYILQSAGVWRANLQSAAALAGGDTILKPLSFDVTYDANLAGEKVQGTEIDEPIRDGKASTKLRLAFSATNAAEHELFMDAYEAGVANTLATAILKMDAVFTGNALGANNYKMSLFFPSLTVDRVSEPITASGRINFTVELHAATSDGAVAGMTGIDKPMQIDLVNSISTDPLV